MAEGIQLKRIAGGRFVVEMKITTWTVPRNQMGLCSLPDFTAELAFQICGGRRIMVAARSQGGLG
jgi:hypothetical protein